MLLSPPHLKSSFPPADLFSSQPRLLRLLSLSILIIMASVSSCLWLAYAALGFMSGVGAEVLSGPSPGVSPSLQDILDKAHKGLYTYPTSFTQGIIPVCYF